MDSTARDRIPKPSPSHARPGQEPELWTGSLQRHTLAPTLAAAPRRQSRAAASSMSASGDVIDKRCRMHCPSSPSGGGCGRAGFGAWGLACSSPWSWPHAPLAAAPSRPPPRQLQHRQPKQRRPGGQSSRPHAKLAGSPWPRPGTCWSMMRSRPGHGAMGPRPPPPMTSGRCSPPSRAR
jgi:hypothetical protein